MKDMFNQDLKINDLIVFANDAGYLTLAIIDEMNYERNVLTVTYRGYREAKTRLLYRPHDTCKISPVFLNIDQGSQDHLFSNSDIAFIRQIYEERIQNNN